MAVLNFDNQGNLYPYGITNLSLDEFIDFFVYAFPPESSRYKIFEVYIDYIQDFRKNVADEFIHWIDGSFVSQKENPGDIDFVSLIPYEIYLKYENKILNNYTMFGVWEKYGDFLDVFATPYFPKEHPNWKLSQANLAYWKDKYGTTRINDDGVSFPKGIISIQFDYFTLK